LNIALDIVGVIFFDRKAKKKKTRKDLHVVEVYLGSELREQKPW